jgi:hypothetical protein
VGDTFALCVPRYPRADEEVEGEVMEPARDQHRGGAEQRPHLFDGAKAALCPAPPDADQHRVGQREEGRNGNACNALRNASPTRQQDQKRPTRNRCHVAEPKNLVEHSFFHNLNGVQLHGKMYRAI